jgi:YidC/Oxa1 family membrane protein insertase
MTPGGFTVPTFAPLDAVLGVAYSLITGLADAFGPVFGGYAAGAAIIAATATVRLLLLPMTLRQVRAERARAALAPRVAELRERHESDPATLARETFALYGSVGAGPLAGCLPMLLQAPFFLVLYRLFASPIIQNGPNGLLVGEFFGVPLGERWAVGGFLAAHDVVFCMLLAVLALIAWWSSRRMPSGAVPVLRLLPFGTVFFAATVPLAAGLYLATTTAWSAAENLVLRR